MEKTNTSFFIGLFLALSCAIFIGMFTAPYGTSMSPTFKENAPVFIMHDTFIKKDINRFDVISVNLGLKNDSIKRVIGLPGETVDYIDGDIYINGEYVENPYVVNKYQQNFSITYAHVELGPDEYYVLGDNQGLEEKENGEHTTSYDSRDYGPVKESQIKGYALGVINIE